jgi:hypothetical protein
MLHKIINYKFLSLSLSLLVLLSCIKSNDHVNNGNIKVFVQSETEGIYINIHNIPPEIDRVCIDIIDESSIINSEKFSKNCFAETIILGNSLEQVKQTGKIFFPFVHSGHKYSIRAHFSYTIFNDGVAERGGSQWVNTEFIAESGKYYDNYLELNLNEILTSVTLSSEPIFSTKMKINQNNYRYGVHILENETSIYSYSYAKTGAGNHWDFVPELANILNENYSRLKYGNYLTYIQSYCNITYDNIIWEVEIANTPVFIYSYNLES